jgi:hypothetical protein
MNFEEELYKIYYNPANSAGFSSVQKLYEAIKSKFPDTTKNKVKNWLRGELAYTLHFPARKNFSRNRILVSHINEQWEADLVDLKEISKYNDNYKYILTVIDCFSKFAFAVPLKAKDANSIMSAFKEIFKNKLCFKLRTDRGTEFLNSQVQNLFKKFNINHFTSYNDTIKCAIIERFNRTLKTKMFKYFTAFGTRRYIDTLEKFLSSYNDTKHRSIKMKPKEVTKNNEKIVFKNLYNGLSMRELIKKVKNPSLKIGEKVRKKYTVGPLEKSYYPNWSDHIYTVDKSIKEENPLYHLKDYSGKPVKQRFQREELQKVEENLHRIEKIIKSKVSKGKKQHFVKWLNYPDTFNSWVLDKDIVKLS